MNTSTKRLNVIAGIGLSIVTLAAISALAWGLKQSGAPSADVGGHSTHAVLYEAEGQRARGLRSASITLQTPDGSSQAQVNLPMRTKAGDTGLTYTFTTGDFVYLSVQNQDAAGSVTCRITVDGSVISENTSSGGYAIATCQGRVP